MKFYATSQISENIHETPEGYLLCLGVSIARTGDQIYSALEVPTVQPDLNGTVTITRDPKEVFRPETIASFQGKSLTIYHPNSFVNKDNWKELSHGIVQNVRRGEGQFNNDLVADLMITDRKAIELVRNGLREVSCGYEAEYVETGVGRGIQRNIIGNHLALVDEGRAGSAYAINDHKGKGSIMKLGDKLKAIFSKAQDEAMEAAKDDAPVTTEATSSYDDLLKAVKDLGSKVEAMKPKDAAAPEAEEKMDDAKEEEKEIEQKDEEVEVEQKDEEVAPGLEERLKKLEDMVAKMLEGQSVGDAEEEKASGNESEDESEEEEVESGDAGCMVGDTASKVEILAPGLKAEGKDIKVKALKQAYATTDGKSAIDSLTGGQEPSYKDEKLVEVLFNGVSEILRAKRNDVFGKTKTHDFQSHMGVPKGFKTPEEINAANAARYKNK